MKSIILGGGCFWCLESVFDLVNGVSHVTSGYAGGQESNPTYKSVCTGTTGHTEVIKVDYEPQIIPLELILKLFFTYHNPTTLNRQGNDVGTQYRSAIYYTDESELPTIQEAIVWAEQKWELPVVTELAIDQIFFPAEDYHQGYYLNNPNQGYCRFVIDPKINHLRKQFASLLKD